MVDVKPGARFRSAVCDAEVVVVRASEAAVDLRCGGQSMVAVADQPVEGLVPKPGFDTGCLIGKRYVDGSGDLEVLCTKSGTSALSIGDEVLVVKDAKPLPSSD